jgi:hypothetical protein
MTPKNLTKLRVEYLAAKRDDRLITMTASQLHADVTAAVASEESDWNAQNGELCWFTMWAKVPLEFCSAMDNLQNKIQSNK